MAQFTYNICTAGFSLLTFANFLIRWGMGSCACYSGWKNLRFESRKILSMKNLRAGPLKTKLLAEKYQRCKPILKKPLKIERMNWVIVSRFKRHQKFQMGKFIPELARNKNELPSDNKCRTEKNTTFLIKHNKSDIYQINKQEENHAIHSPTNSHIYKHQQENK